MKEDNLISKGGNLVVEKSYDFSVRIAKLYRFLCEKKKENIISRQVLRSRTSIGANVEEAIGGVSRKDFLNKLSIVYKEARETNYWLRILRDIEYLNQNMFDSLIKDCDEVTRIIFSIIRTSKNNDEKSSRRD
ncbi:MAG TPA: four helix bundle protein [Ignavibacteria bacterium]|nr:four helix bundle protein [Ignavibacteria bacterium]